MKFWRILSKMIDETLPDWRENFLSYKDLKKKLKMIYPIAGESVQSNATSAVRSDKRPRLADGEISVEGDQLAMGEEVIDFVRLLEDEIEKFNSFFVDKEERYIIKLKMVQDKVAEVRDSDEELMSIGREVVDFHGEMVLLLNYSALNYIGLVKILKKYDKRSGALIRLPFIQKVLKEPFFSTDVLNKLVKECEKILERFFPAKEHLTKYETSSDGNHQPENPSASNTKGKESISVPDELSQIKDVENMYMKQTVTALQVLTKIRSGSSTVDMFSLPPM
ncbi:SPX domain-containing protein 2-like [Impatiens glandulifera]|uniref:SPX domain-containing protein 2-like n=1 Tax=Impatiens glandulifera TaxID=253017 RepID=UPI001FB07545|nr:SPX domain-containing protein 2-like [Impatiens glandulifera]